MRRNLITAFCTVLVLCSVVLCGCKDGGPTSELDKFLFWAENIEQTALQDTMRVISASTDEHAKYADYVLGNLFYTEAGDSAMVVGWNVEPVTSLMDSAQYFLERSVTRDSTFVEALVNLGSLWDDRSQQISARENRDGRTQKAEEYYFKALELSPGDEKARCNLGSLYLRQRKTEKALAEFKTALEYNPGSSLAHYNMAIMFAEAKIYREAIAEWEMAAEGDDDDDIGERSRENIKIVKQLMNSPIPENIK